MYLKIKERGYVVRSIYFKPERGLSECHSEEQRGGRIKVWGGFLSRRLPWA